MAHAPAASPVALAETIATLQADLARNRAAGVQAKHARYRAKKEAASGGFSPLACKARRHVNHGCSASEPSGTCGAESYVHKCTGTQPRCRLRRQARSCFCDRFPAPKMGPGKLISIRTSSHMWSRFPSLPARLRPVRWEPFGSYSPTTWTRSLWTRLRCFWI